jgi:hypothetical protein
VKMKMEQINLEHVYAPECVEFKICLENLMDEDVKKDFKRIITEKFNNNASKLVKKAELNAKYIEELKTIKLMRAQTNYRQYGVF